MVILRLFTTMTRGLVGFAPSRRMNAIFEVMIGGWEGVCCGEAFSPEVDLA